MLLMPTISRLPETDPALDQAQLYALGLDHIRRLSRRLWTDHNTHDPGITILELLCYALTDLTYRTQFPLEDLLATTTDNAANMAGQFFTPRQVLPNRALTALDYRKLLIDLPGVKNAWLSPAAQRYFADPVAAKLHREDPGTPGVRPVDLSGLYRVRIEYMDRVTTKAERARIDADAHALLQANRNLCEDFIAVVGVDTQPYSLCAEIELELAADPSLVAARVHFEVQRYFAPPVYNYSLSEMLAKRHQDGSPYTVEEIFDGPLLVHGFIDEAELAAAELRTEIRLSDIVGVIMDIEGVRAVRDILVNELEPQQLKALEPADKWRLPVPEGKQARLSEEHGRLVFYKGTTPVMADQVKVWTHLDALDEAVRARLDTPSAEDLPLPLGRYRDTARYPSFQQHFPLVYGLSDAGLPASADPLRRAQALQLKAYLLFFDQVMANYFAQLANVRELFARAPAQEATYFAQVVDSFPDHERIYPQGIDDGQLAALLEDSEAALERRSRLLDHLLARFAEDFHRYVSIVRSTSGASLQSTIATKRAFLAAYPQQAAERGLAYNYALTAPEALWNSLNVSGLERRLARLLGIGDYSRRNLGSVSYDTYTELDQTPGDEYRFRVKHPVSGKILLSSSTRYPTPEAAHAAMELAISLAQRPGAYRRKTTVDGKYYFNVVDGNEEIVARRIEYFATAEALDAVIEDLVTHLREYYSGEGMYLIENILLRPEEESDPFLPICIDPGRSDCPDQDPYSYRLQIVLPAYAGRFQDMDFRHFVEETIRLETPAHLLPKICWVDAEDMARFEQAYRDWIALRAGVAGAQRKEKLAAFVAALFQIKNVYPKRKLRGCGGGEAKPPFVLDRTTLGSKG